MSKSILIIEDNRDLIEYLREILSQERYSVYTATTGIKGRKLFFSINPSLVLLDLHLPDIQGEQLRAEFKDMEPDIPIIILTADTDSDSVARNLKRGADDYIKKPFTSDELIARINARIRLNSQKSPILKAKDLSLNTESTQVKYLDKSINLTKTEFDLLRYLLENKNRLVTREMILSHVWNSDPDVQTRVVDVYVGYLRKKLRQNSDQVIIDSKRGFGYIIND